MTLDRNKYFKGKNNSSARVKIEDLENENSFDCEKANKNLVEYTKAIISDISNNSLTKQFLSLELALCEVNVRTVERTGLGQCIYVNFNNPTSIYPYAASADCYCVFCDFFGPLIDYIHGPPQNEAYLEPLYGDISKYESLDLNYQERRRVIYADVTVRRNLEGFPFTPMMNGKDRKSTIKELEKIFLRVFESEEELAEIPTEWENKFDRIKNELDDLGAMKDYPDDRLHLIFQTISDIYMGIVVNFDDHLQIITSCYDGRIGKLYRNMYETYTDPNLDDLDFVAHPFLGYLTLSPCHIGTGMTIRIIAKFPFLSRIGNIENSILRNHDVIVEPENPECPSSGLILIYNKKTLNKSEEDILNDVVNAYNVLYEVEQELEATTPMAVQNDTMPVESLQRLVDTILKSESRSYTKKFLTPNIVSIYDSEKTRFGNTLNHCVRANSIYPDSLYPRTTDSDCYSKFRLFFTPILYEINKIRSTAHPAKPNYGYAGDNVQYMIHHRDVLSYRVRFARNFENYPFPNSLSHRDREDVERIIVDTFEDFPLEIEGKYVPLNRIKLSVYYEDFVQYNLLPDLSDVEKSSGCYRDWPLNRGIFFVNKECKYPDLVTVIFVNITEHIKVMCLDTIGKNLHACYDRAVKIMKFLDLRFENTFARKPGYGFLTSFPQSVGCGLRISAKVRLKNLGDKREILEQIIKTYNFVFRGSKGAGSPAITNVFDVSLKFNMNVTEKWVLLTFSQRLKDLLLEERAYDVRIPRPNNCVYVEEKSSNDDDSTTILMKDQDPLSDMEAQIEIRKEENEEDIVHVPDRDLKNLTSMGSREVV